MCSTDGTCTGCTVYTSALDTCWFIYKCTFFPHLRYMALLKTGIASEGAMLARRNELIDDNVVAANVSMVHKCDSAAGKSGQQTKPTPLVYTRSLVKLVLSHLDAHEK